MLGNRAEATAQTGVPVLVQPHVVVRAEVAQVTANGVGSVGVGICSVRNGLTVDVFHQTCLFRSNRDLVGGLRIHTEVLQYTGGTCPHVLTLRGFKQNVHGQALEGHRSSETSTVVGVWIANNALLNGLLRESVVVQDQLAVRTALELTAPQSAQGMSFNRTGRRTGEACQEDGLNTLQILNHVAVAGEVAVQIPFEIAGVYYVQFCIQFQTGVGDGGGVVPLGGETGRGRNVHSKDGTNGGVLVVGTAQAHFVVEEAGVKSYFVFRLALRSDVRISLNGRTVRRTAVVAGVQNLTPSGSRAGRNVVGGPNVRGRFNTHRTGRSTNLQERQTAWVHVQILGQVVRQVGRRVEELTFKGRSGFRCTGQFYKQTIFPIQVHYGVAAVVDYRRAAVEGAVVRRSGIAQCEALLVADDEVERVAADGAETT